MSNFEINKGDDLIIGLDISGSMRSRDVPEGTRYDYAVKRAEEFAYELSKYDTDGVSVHLFGEKVHVFPDLKPDELGSKLQWSKFEMQTNTHLVVRSAWAEHKERGNEQTFLLIFTDGEPSDQQALISEISKITGEMKDEREFNIGILTVGTRTPELEAALVALDDALPGGKYDIVDVKDAYEVTATEAVAGSLED